MTFHILPHPPDEVKRLFQGAFSDGLIDTWWSAQNKLLNMQRPREVWADDPDRVLEMVENFRDGAHR